MNAEEVSEDIYKTLRPRNMKKKQYNEKNDV